MTAKIGLPTSAVVDVTTEEKPSVLQRSPASFKQSKKPQTSVAWLTNMEHMTVE